MQPPRIKVAACVTLYHPDESTAHNIRSYIDVVDRLYLLNNGGGEAVAAELCAEYAKAELITYPENMAIAKPFNDALKLASGKYDYLLTMDQDSHFTPGSAQRYVDELQRLVATEKTDILGLSPVFIPKETNKPVDGDIHWQREYVRLTSGNLINVAKAIEIGGFAEELFIDEVDYDFSLRGYLAGFHQYRCNCGIYLVHHLGNEQPVRLFGRTYYLGMYNHIRTYYICRNRIYMLRKYWHINAGLTYRLWIRSMFRLLVSKIFFETDRPRKLLSVVSGTLDGLFGRLGKKDFGD